MRTQKRWTAFFLALITAFAGRFALAELTVTKAPMPSAHAVSAQLELGTLLLVNRDYLLLEDYVPEDLVNVYDQARSFSMAKADITLKREAFEAANRMFESARQDGIEGFILTSGYRSYARQRELYDESRDGTAAYPGTSEHQTGLALDVTAYNDGGFQTTEQFRWLSAHCHEHGFILRYPEGDEEITGIPYEPWHYRYVGADAARIMHENGWTLEEYFEGGTRNG